jgi:hypothetical protein
MVPYERSTTDHDVCRSLYFSRNRENKIVLLVAVIIFKFVHIARRRFDVQTPRDLALAAKLVLSPLESRHYLQKHEYSLQLVE